ncbi:MAG: ABC transporter ATP-binding protein [Nitrospinota bacterium]
MGFRVEGLQQRYDGRLVLDIPRLILPRGSSTVLFGPNGAGKSTLLRLLAAVEAPSRGRVFFDGRPLEGEATPLEVRRQLTLVMQEPFLFRGSVRRNVLYGLLARGVPRREAEARAQAALDQVGLAGFEERSSRSLSGGEAQRVALARALALGTPALLLDEPSAHVDAESLARMLEILGELRRQGQRTLLFATHQETLAEGLADHIVRLNGGKLGGEE